MEQEKFSAENQFFYRCENRIWPGEICWLRSLFWYGLR